MMGGVLAVVLTPFATFAGWLAGPDQTTPPTYPDMPWAQLIEPLVTPFLGFATYEEVYATYGKVFFLVYLLFLIGMVGLHARVGEHIRRSGKLAFRLAFVGLAMNLVGNVTDYWLGEKVLGQVLWGGSFAIFTLLGTLVLITGLVLLGLSALRMQALPRWIAWPLIILPPSGILLTFWGIKHTPSATMLPLSIAWILLGYVLLAEKWRPG